MALRQRLTHASLVALIEQAYASVDQDVGWTPFLLALGDCLGARVPALVRHDLSQSGDIVVNVRADPEATRLYNEHWNREDPWALSPRVPQLVKPGRVLIDEMLVPSTELQRSDYFNCFAVKYDVARLMTGALEVDRFRYEGLSITRAQSDPPFGLPEMRFLAALLPHVQRACRLHDVITHVQRSEEQTRQALEWIPFGIIFADAQSGVVHANGVARDILERGDGLTADRTGLRGATPAITARLRSLCQRPTSAEATASDAGDPLMLPRPSGAPSLHLLALPLFDSQPYGLKPHGTTVVLWLTDPLAPPRPLEERIRAYYGFTPAESAIASRLALGHSLEDIGDALQYTRETMRWYSKRILDKAGCRTRSELVKRLASLHLLLQLPQR